MTKRRWRSVIELAPFEGRDMVDGPKDVWSGGASYEQFIGRWSRPVARAFLKWLAPRPGGVCLDVGCGTGALTGALARAIDPMRVEGVDPSLPFVEYARAHTDDSRVVFAVADARTLPYAEGAFDVVVSGLMINFVDPPGAAVAEMIRVARRGGIVGAYVWDYAEGMRLLRHFWDAAIASDPRAIERDEARRFPTCQMSALADLFRSGGLHDVDTTSIDVTTRFRDFDDCWAPFLEGQGPAPGYVAGLDEAARLRLRDRFHAALPVGPDGSIELTARAWAVRGTAAR
jgi:SAM-dependent methyltransferase